MPRKFFATLVALPVLLSTFSADAALDAVLRVRGQKSGDVKGSLTQRGREGMIGIVGSSDEIVSPRDPATGLPTGKRMHKPFVITKELDKSSPVLRQMIVTNENLTEVDVQYFSGSAGAPTLLYTVRLTNASIASIRTVQEDNRKADQSGLPILEEVSFTYQKITWTWAEGGISSTDTWQ